MADFGKQVEAHAARYKARLRAVAKESLQTTVRLAQRTTGDGGRMRVDTGFLRASIAGKVGSMPSGNAKPSAQQAGPLTTGGQLYTFDGETISVALLRWNPEMGETMFIGWTANYARPREYRDGFLRGATEKWDQTVRTTAARIRTRI